MSSPLAGLRVLECGGSVAGAYAAKLLADAGAEVLVTEPQGLAHYDRNKSIVPDADLVGSASDVDVVIESSAPDPLIPRLAARPGLVRLHLSPFGSTGPYAGFRSSDLCDYAISGHQYLYGDPDRAPLPGPPDQPAIAAGLFGCIGVLAALYDEAGLHDDAGLHDEGAAAGTTIEVSHHEAMAGLHQLTLLRYQFGGTTLRRMGNRYTGPGQPNGLYRCADGWVAVAGITEPQLETLLGVTGLDHLMDDPAIESVFDFQVHPDLLEAPLAAWLAERPRDEVVELFQTLRIPTCPALRPLELLDDPQLVARDFWVDGSDGVKTPGPPFRIQRRPGDGHSTTSGRENKLGGAAEGHGPLHGVRVLDLTRVWAGPLAARILADLGADVIMVEAPWSRGPRNPTRAAVLGAGFYPDNEAGEKPWNRYTHVCKYSVNKRALAVDLTQPDGVAAVLDLVATADVLMENYSPRVMGQLGLGDDDLWRHNPDLIVTAMPGYGRDGPARDWVAYGSVLDSHGGLSFLNGYEGEAPWKSGVAWPDPMAGLHATVGTLMALLERRREGGGGRVVELSQFEAIVNVVGADVEKAQRAGRDLLPRGARHPDHAPQGVYPCLGDDRWVSVSVDSDDTWRALVEEANLPTEWGSWGRDERRHHHTEIDAAVTCWTLTHDAPLVMYRLQARGVAAAPVIDAGGLRSDPHLNARALLVTVDQPDVGAMAVTRSPIRIDGRFPEARPAPTLGEHNAEVLAEAGHDATSIADLEKRGVVATIPPEPD